LDYLISAVGITYQIAFASELAFIVATASLTGACG
jgi:hypothetical protein